MVQLFDNLVAKWDEMDVVIDDKEAKYESRMGVYEK